MGPLFDKGEGSEPANPAERLSTEADLARQQPHAGELLRLVEQSLWANRLWIEFVHSQLEPESRPRELLGHLVVAERVWLDRIDGEQKTPEMFPTLQKGELLRGLDENHRRCIDLMTGARLEDVIHFRRDTGEQYHARIADIILHLVTHGHHHRGQLAMHYGRKGVSDYPSADHIDFLIANAL